MLDHLGPGGESEVRFFRQLGCIKVVMYAREFGKLFTCPGKVHVLKNPEKNLSFHFVLIPRLTSLLKW